jgi:uncharacterized protein YybS (DUF2232 family)
MSGRTRALVEGGILSSVAVILTLVAVYIPIVWTIVQLIQAFPIMILVFRQGIKPGLIATVVTTILIFMLGNLLVAMFFLSMSPVALVMGWAMRKGKNAAWTLTLGTLSGFFAKLAALAFSIFFLKINYATKMEEMIRASVVTVIENYRSMGVDQETLQEITRYFDQAIPVLLTIIPVIIIVGAVTEAYINLWLARLLLRKMGQTVDGFPPLKHWDLPRTFLYGWLLSFFSWKAGAYYFGEQALTYKFGINCFAFFSGILFLQGLAVLSFYLAKYNVSKLLRILMVLLIFILPILLIITIYAGVIDMFANFRRLRRGE